MCMRDRVDEKDGVDEECFCLYLTNVCKSGGGVLMFVSDRDDDKVHNYFCRWVSVCIKCVTKKA